MHLLPAGICLINASFSCGRGILALRPRRIISLAVFVVYPLEQVADFRHIFLAGSLIVDPEKTLGPVYA